MPPSSSRSAAKRTGTSVAAEGRQGGAHVLVRGFEQAPHVHLAVVARRRLAHVAPTDPQRGHSPRVPVQSAGREQASGEGEAEHRRQGLVVELGVDLVGDRLERVQVARGVQVEDLVCHVAPVVEDREPILELLVGQALADIGPDGHRDGRGAHRGRIARTVLGSQRDGRIRCPGRRGRRTTGLTERRQRWLVQLHRLTDEAHRCGRQILVGIGRRLDRRRLGRARRFETELRVIGLVHGGHPLVGPAERDVTGGAAVDLPPRGVAVPRPDELLHHDRPIAARAAGGVQLLDVLAERDVHPP